MIELDEEDIYKILQDKSIEEQLEILTNSWNTSYGKIVQHDDSLIEFITGGWSDNEYLIRVFCNFVRNYNFAKYKVGELTGGSHYFYFKEDKYNTHFKIVKEVKE